MIEALKYVNLKENLTPNQYYLLWCMYNEEEAHNINESLEKRSLINKGFLNEDDTIPDEVIERLIYIDAIYTVKLNKTRVKLMGDNHLENIQKYRELFPTGKLPSGLLARQPERELTQNFIWFFQNYPQYDWDIVLRATKNYVDGFTESLYGMRTSKYFIVKTDPTTKITTSDLANECRDIIESKETTKPFVDNGRYEIR